MTILLKTKNFIKNQDGMTNNFSCSNIFDHVLKFAVVSTFDSSLGPSWQFLFELSPMFSLLEDQLTNFQILFERKLWFVDVGPEIV